MYLYLHSLGYGAVANGYLSTRPGHNIQMRCYRRIIGFGLCV